MDLQTPNRPEHVTDEMMEYLFELRETAQVNMFHAPRFLAVEFDLNPADAKEAAFYWMQNFEQLEAARSTT